MSQGKDKLTRSQIVVCASWWTKSTKTTCSADSDQTVLSFEDWCQKRQFERPQFEFWNLVPDMELTVFVLIRSFKEGDFILYREALSELSPYFFRNKIVNYARWIPIHLHNIICLEKQYPDLVKEFHQANFAVRKSRK